jgi:hypothetical protein
MAVEVLNVKNIRWQKIVSNILVFSWIEVFVCRTSRVVLGWNKLKKPV